MLNKLRIVMVRPQGSGNVGSVARAMKNVGASELAIVGDARTQSFWAKAMAVHGRDVLAEAKHYPTIREAIADCIFVVGTTCRTGLYRSHSQSVREAAPSMAAALSNGKVALLFGPEDHGLSNKDLEHCQELIIIPANPEYQSYNVAQAAVICLYEIYVASLEKPPAANEFALAQAEDIERLFDLMRSSLLKIGFLNAENPEHILLALRRILGRGGLAARDSRILTAMFRQIEWFAKDGWKAVEEKERQGIKIK